MDGLQPNYMGTAEQTEETSAGRAQDKEKHPQVSGNQTQLPIDRSIAMEDVSPPERQRGYGRPPVNITPTREMGPRTPFNNSPSSQPEDPVERPTNPRKRVRFSPGSPATRVYRWAETPQFFPARPVLCSDIKGSGMAEASSSDREQKAGKSRSYLDPRYETGLANRGSVMTKCPVTISSRSAQICQDLLSKEQRPPVKSKFADELFERTCEMVRRRNEIKVIIDIGRLIVPSVETLALYGATHLDLLIESYYDSWIKCIPFYGPCPQPSYSVGFRRSAFTDEQLERLQPYIGSLDHLSYFMATDEMYFPFLTAEVQSSFSGSLVVADRQNAHSMTVAVKGIVELFRAAKREKELHRQILGFSISYDALAVRIYGHFSLINEGKTTFYRHEIRQFYFAADKEDRWTANRFTRNIYETWAPMYLERICSAIDQLPYFPGVCHSPVGALV